MTEDAVAAEPGAVQDKHFRFQRLVGETHLAQSFALRFQVFCRERGFYPPEDYPDGRESDACDPRALHFGAFDRAGAMAGTVRLIPFTAADIPLRRHCRLWPRWELGAEDHGRVAEISRLAISAAYRRRRQDGLYALATAGPDGGRERRGSRPELVFGLYRAMYHASKRVGIARWCAAMEPGLARQLRRLGVYFDAAGPENDYHGPVVPYMVAIEDFERTMSVETPEAFRALMIGLEPALWPVQARVPEERPAARSAQ